MDLIGFIIGKYSQTGVDFILGLGDLNATSDGSPPRTGHLFLRIAFMITGELDRFHELQSRRLIVTNVYSHRCTSSSSRLQLIYKGLSLIENLLPNINVAAHIAGFRFLFLSMLTRVMQMTDISIADQASIIRGQLIESGCLDLFPEPDRSSESCSLVI